MKRIEEKLKEYRKLQPKEDPYLRLYDSLRMKIEVDDPEILEKIVDELEMRFRGRIF